MTGFTGIFSKHFALETWRQSAPLPFSPLPPLLVGKDWGLMLNLALAVSRLSFIYVVWTAQFPRYYSSDHPTAAAIGYFNITQSSARYQEETFLPYLGIPYNGGRVAHASKWHSSEACEHPCTPLCGPQRLPSEWGMYKRLSLVSAGDSTRTKSYLHCKVWNQLTNSSTGSVFCMFSRWKEENPSFCDNCDDSAPDANALLTPTLHVNPSYKLLRRWFDSTVSHGKKHKHLLSADSQLHRPCPGKYLTTRIFSIVFSFG